MRIDLIRRRLPLTVLLVLAPAIASAQQFDPAYRFRVLPTDHFRIYFHQGEQELAGRLASVAEDVWLKAARALGGAPARTDVILIDQSDVANGWATPIPRDTIAIYPVWPAGSDPLKTDDWLRLVFTHEFTHIVHLNRSGGWARVVRRIFGRTPIAMPNLFLPAWQVEGLATFEESALTGEGRLHAGNFRAVVGEAARAGRFLPVDRVNGGLTRWPGGQAHYAYGLSFHAHLAGRYGAETLQQLADRTARSLPYFGARAFKSVYGKPLGALWREFEEAERAAATPRTAPDTGRRLTQHRYVVSGPRFVLPACSACPAEIVYSARNADEWPSLYRLALGPAPTASERVATRFLGATLGAGRDRIYFDQQEARRNAGLYSDLYSLDRHSGRVRRLTDGQRLIDPDVSPDGRRIAAVRVHPGRRDLVVVRLASPDEVAGVALLATGPETQFNAPRWSPDGLSIVVQSQRLGQLPQLELVDPASGTRRALTTGASVRWATPAWRRDGQAVVAAAAAGDDPFNLFEIAIATGRIRQLTRTTGGATWPDVSPDGSSIVYAGYTADGFELFAMPYPSEGTPDLQVGGPPGPEGPGLQTPRGSGPGTSGPPDLRMTRPYSPWPTLLPTSWLPVVASSANRVGVGAEVAGTDVLGYHRYSASGLQWLPAGRGSVDRGTATDWAAGYAYTRWRPAFYVSISRETTFSKVDGDGSGEDEPARRETELEAGAELPIARVRTWHLARASILRRTTRASGGAGPEDGPNRGGARFAWAFRSAAQFGNSISPERGVIAGATAELVRVSLGADADATTIAGDFRVYLPLPGDHQVLAIRAAAGRTTGSRLTGRRFTLGGAGPDVSPIDFGSDAISLLRGFPGGAFAGSRIALMNVDYRFPLRRVERGRGTWPIFLHTIHGAIFADAGHVWTNVFARSDLKISAGAEIAADVVLGYVAPMTIAAGAARGHDGGGRRSDRTTFYARVGYAF